MVIAGGVLSIKNGRLSSSPIIVESAGFDDSSLATTRTSYVPSGSVSEFTV
jgi:hypothetical protein